MGIVERAIGLIGSNRTSYIFSFVGITFWFLGNTLGAEDKNLTFGIITLWRGIVSCAIAIFIIKTDNLNPYVK